MGLSERKQKQRLVGASVSRNNAWASDASLPGQRLLAGMGWSAGQSIGGMDTSASSSRGGSGMSTPTMGAAAMGIKFKMDNKGIGVDRAEKDARAAAIASGGSASLDAWATSGAKDFGSLLERLNAANQQTQQAAASSSSSSSEASGDAEAEVEKPSKKKSKDKESDKKKGKKRARDETASGDAEEDDSKAAKRARKEARKLEKELRKATKKAGKGKKEKGAAAVVEDALQVLDKTAEGDAAENKAEVQAAAAIVASVGAATPVAIPGRLAHRAKYLRAKKAAAGSGMNSLNEILGIVSNSPSPAPQPAKKIATGPGGSEVEVMMKRPPQEEPQCEAPAEVADDDKKKRKSKKSKKEAAPAEEDKAAENTSKRNVDPSLDPAQSNLKISSLGVFEYLSNRLIVRKAAVMRAQKAKQTGVWDRVAAIGA